MDLTTEQEKAAFCDKAEVFVAAGAGSGKTKLLVERYLYLVLEKGIPLSRLVTVSFTRKAASELKDRIRKKLIENGEPDLAWALDDAPIGTIHSLCARLLRAHPVAVRVDPSFTVMGEVQGKILLDEAATVAWEERLAVASDPELDLVVRDGDTLRKSIVGFYSVMRQEGWDPPYLQAELGGNLEDGRAEMEMAVKEVLREISDLDLKKTARGNLEKMGELLQCLPGMVPSFEDMEKLGDLMPALNTGRAEKPHFQKLKDEMLAFRSMLGSRYLAGAVGFLNDVFVALDGEYRDRKRRDGVLDYTDLELGARDLLSAGAQQFPAGSYLLVDEFQDTNRLQCQILEGLCPTCLLTVGDERQSIYAFRGADVEVFRKKSSDLRGESGDGDSTDKQITELRSNFRSRTALVDVVNHVFGSEEFFGRTFLRLDPRRDQREGHRSAEDSGSVCGEVRPAVEVDLIETAAASERDDSNGNPVDRVVAARIKRLVTDEGWRYRDIVVLLRRLTKVAELEKEMRHQGVPTYVVQGRGYFAREELTDVLCLLKVLVNPRDDVALVTVLRSPLVGISDDTLWTLARLRQRGRSRKSFWEALSVLDTWEAEELEMPQGEIAGLEALRVGVQELRRSVGSPGLAALIEESVNRFNYDLAMLATSSGIERLANVRKLMQLAEQFEDAEGPDLARFVRHLEIRQSSSDREGSAATLGEEDNVVRVMTVHQAKGLEFPVVVIGEADNELRKKSQTLSVDRSGRVAWRATGPGYPGARNGAYVSFGPYEEIRAEEDQSDKEESDRLYYVAMTRAEERVVIMGSSVEQDSGSFLGKILRAVEAEKGTQEKGEGASYPLPGLDLAICRLEIPDSIAHDTGDPSQQRVAAPLFIPPVSASVEARSAPSVVSFSDLKLFSECPRRYYLERILGIRPPDDSGTGSDPRRRGYGGLEYSEDATDALWDEKVEVGSSDGVATGLAVHSVLERLPLERPPGDTLVSRLLEEEFKVLDEHPSAQAVGRAADLVKAFWKSPFLGCEELSRARKESRFVFSQGEVLVTGVMDLLVAEAPEWLVVDYKTNRLGGASPEEAAAAYKLQAEIYSLACLASGAPAVRVGLLFLEEPEAPVIRRYEQDTQTELGEKLEGLLREVRAGNFPQTAQGCFGCPFNLLCGHA